MNTGKRNRGKKIALACVILGSMISFPLIMLLVAMFYSAVLGNGSFVVHINNYNEMHIETYFVVPLVVFLTFLNTMYSLNRADRELKQLLKRTSKADKGQQDKKGN